MMKCAVFVEPNRIALEEKPVPNVDPLDALICIFTTTICGTDVHILKGEYPVAKGLTIGHEPVGIVEKLGSAVEGCEEGQRVIAGAITPSGHSAACLCCYHSQDGAGTKHGFKPLGGWRFGNTIDGAQAEYLLVPDAMTNLALIPVGLTDEQVLMCPDIISTGISGAESGKVRVGDTKAVLRRARSDSARPSALGLWEPRQNRRRGGTGAHGDRIQNGRGLPGRLHESRSGG
ncbi:MAG: alcohol dehydrogenase catalytic domain-containing protein [Rhodospirillaceae bacterium]|nr:alcohol dehydrogenase catalytic domain-containing protein [Rhodospirillaceae bacterium]